MTHYLLTDEAEFDRSAIHQRAKELHRGASERGDASPFADWLKYAWRTARAQREAAAISRMEALARRVVGERR